MAIGKTVWTYFEETWHQGDLAVMKAADHAMWLGTLVFDGARAFEGVTPDLDMHCARLLRSAEIMGLDALHTLDELMAITHDGLSRFDADEAVYIRPMYWSTASGPGVVVADPTSTAFALSLESFPMIEPDGISLSTTQYCRPFNAMMPTEAKAACLYPNNGRMLREVQAKGFQNAIVCDPLGNVAETATSNIFMARDGKVYTPVPNGTFLNGVTRRRIIGLLRDAGETVIEQTLSLDDFRGADEVFTTGNIFKVVPVSRFDDIDYPIGPFARLSRDLYWKWAKG